MHESASYSLREDPERRTVVPAGSQAPVRDLRGASDCRTVNCSGFVPLFSGSRSETQSLEAREAVRTATVIGLTATVLAVLGVEGLAA